MRHNNLDRVETSLVEWQVADNERAQHVDDGGVQNRCRSVEVLLSAAAPITAHIVGLWTGTGEVKHRITFLPINGDLEN